MAQTPDFNTGLFLADTSSAAGTVILPFASEVQGRTITIKDANQSFGMFPCYIQTSVGDVFQDGTSTLTLDITDGFITLVAYGTTWYTIGEFQNLFNSTIFTSSIQVSSITTNVVNLSNAAPLTFTPVANDFSWVNGLLYTPSKWVAVGHTAGTSQGTIQTSSNGLNWIPQINPLTEGYAVAYNGSNLYTAVGYTDGTSNSTIITSPDAITWTPQQTTLTRVRTVAHDQYTRWMVGGYTDGTSNGVLQTSTDGSTWTNLPAPDFTDVYGLSIGEAVWIAVGYTDGTSNGTLQTSTDDGQTWISRTTPFTSAYAVSYNGLSQWVAMGYTDGTSTGTILTSSDTQTWVPQSNNFTSTLGAVVYGGGQWVATGNANESKSASIQRSYNGSNWTPVSNALTEGYAIAYNGVNQWVVGGYTNGTTFGTLQTSITNSDIIFSNTNLYFLNNKILMNQNGEADSVAIGTRSGVGGQSTQSVAVGFAAGELRQREKAVAIGANAGQNDQQKDTVAIGSYAGQTGQGTYAVAIGAFAGQSFQADHSIALNATASTLNTSNAGFYVAPIREINSLTNLPLTYSRQTKEVMYSDQLSLSSLYLKDASSESNAVPLYNSTGTLYFNGIAIANSTPPESLLISSISTHSLTVYGSNTLIVQGFADIAQLQASSLALGADYSPLTLSSGYLYAGASPISTVGGGGGGGDVTTGSLVSTVEGLATFGHSFTWIRASNSGGDLYGQPSFISPSEVTISEAASAAARSVERFDIQKLGLYIEFVLPDVSALDTSDDMILEGGGYNFWAELTNTNQITFKGDGPSSVGPISYTPGDIFREIYDGRNVYFYINNSLEATFSYGSSPTDYLYMGFYWEGGPFPSLPISGKPNNFYTFSNLKCYPVPLYNETLISSVNSLGTVGYISTSQLVSTVEGLTFGTGEQLVSTVSGLGDSSYISTPSLLSSLNALSFVSTPSLVSSISSLQTLFQTSSLTASTFALKGTPYPGYSPSPLTALPPGAYSRIDASIDGSIIVANGVGPAPIYLSSNGGQTFTTKVGPAPWVDVSISYDGSKMLAGYDAGGYVVLVNSLDSGASWNTMSGQPTGNMARMAISGDGNTWIAGKYGEYLYTSFDNGSNWAAVGGLGTGNWFRVATSYTGQYIYALNATGYIYVSANYGSNDWTPITSLGTRFWNTVCCSSNGQIAYAAAGITGYTFTAIARTIDYGSNWSYLSTDALPWSEINCSLDGTNVVAATYTGDVYYSIDTGSNWIHVAPIGSSNIASISVNSNASQVYVASYNTTNYILNYGLLYNDNSLSVSSGYLFVNTSPISTVTSQFLTISSLTTQYLTAAKDVYMSGLTTSTISTGILNVLDYPGYAWQSLTSTGRQPWTPLAMTPDATKLVAGEQPGSIWTSSNSGTTWTEQTGAGSNSWLSLSMSDNGSNIFAGAADVFLVSSDSGVTWADRTPSPHAGTGWIASACSSNGSTLYVADIGGYVFKSTDYGSNWTQITDLGTATWISLCCSKDGTRAFAAAYGSPTYRSEDSGATWSPIIGPGNWYSVTCSYDGLKVALCLIGQYVYTSPDGGSNWVAQVGGGARGWVSLASSSNGSRLVASVDGSTLFTSDDYGVTWTPAPTVASSWRIVAASADGNTFAGADLGYYTGGGYITLGKKTTLYSALTLSSGYMFVNSSNLKTTADLSILSTVAGLGSASYISTSQTQIRIGQNAGILSNGTNTIAIGVSSANTSQGERGIAIGSNAGAYSQGAVGLALGVEAGFSNQAGGAVAIGALTGYTGQGSVATSIGYYTGYSNQGAYGIAIGTFAGSNAQGTEGIAIGLNAAISSQGATAIAIGKEAGWINQGSLATAVGPAAGKINQGVYTVAVGISAGLSNQGPSAVGIGLAAGSDTQGASAVAIGPGAAVSTQGVAAIAIGNDAAAYAQGDYSIALGRLAAQVDQGDYAIAQGYYAGQTTQGGAAIAIGQQTANYNQGPNSIALGLQTAMFNQATNAVAIGTQAGHVVQSTQAVAIGYQAGFSNQDANSVGIGYLAGFNQQSTNSLAIGTAAGYSLQGTNTVAIGPYAGYTAQQAQAIGIGYAAGSNTQGNNSVSVGNAAGAITQGCNAVALGYAAGFSGQGSNAIAIGYLAGCNSQTANSIAINASGAPFQATEAGFFVNPVRTISDTTPLTFNYVTGEIGYSSNLTLSTLQVSSIISDSLISTLNGLGDLGYVSTLSLTSTVEGLGTYGYVSTTMARANICQAKLTTTQTILNNTDTIVEYTDDIDPNNWWNSSTYQFQPNIAGYYLINACVWWAAGASNLANQTNLQIRKNGSGASITQNPIFSQTGNSQSITRLFQLNGSSDYLDVTVYTGNTTSQDIQASGGSVFTATLQ